MVHPRESLQADLTAAMKARESERVKTLRMLLAAVKNQGIELGREVDDQEFVQLVRKAIKQRQEAAEQFRLGKRDELAAKEEAEIQLLEDYLPAQVDEAALRAAIAELIAEQGLSGPKGIGPVMKAMLAKFAGAADGATINRIARELLDR